MFISIPEEFFVPVLFSSRFKFNSENNNMEYDTDNEKIINSGYRSPGEEITEEIEEKEKVQKEIKLDSENDEEILNESDEEYIHSQTVGK
ncbi:MAG: hypothetical protein RSD13_05210 [Clostridium sp.]